MVDNELHGAYAAAAGMKILLFGAGGQVGWELQRSLSPLGEVVALDFDSRDHCGDFTNLPGLVETVHNVRPTVIVNAAAHTAVDKAEGEPGVARLLNALAPGAVSKAAREIGALVVHYSTDYVFDGSGDQPRDEDDPKGPLSVYGATKLEGEQLVAEANPRHLIFRTSWVYAARGGNFAKTMLRLAKERERLTVIDDQIGAPTGADLLADVTAHALRAVVDPLEQGRYGVYHVVAGGQTSWHGYATFVVNQARELGCALKATAETIDPVPTTAFPTPAQRPKNSRLSAAKFQRTFGLTLPPWQQGVARMLKETL
jgi:dTDP-4-dehydrorhamnose reductase